MLSQCYRCDCGEMGCDFIHGQSDFWLAVAGQFWSLRTSSDCGLVVLVIGSAFKVSAPSARAEGPIHPAMPARVMDRGISKLRACFGKTRSLHRKSPRLCWLHAGEVVDRRI